MFEIITEGKPSLRNSNLEDSTVAEAISTIYPNDNSFIIYFNWNGFYIPLDGISFSSIYNDVIDMLESIEMGEKKFSNTFFDSCFTARWESELIHDNIKVIAFWTDIASFGRPDTTVQKLREVSNTIIVNQQNFINSWESLLKIIKEDLIKAGYDNKLDGFEYLEKL